MPGQWSCPPLSMGSDLMRQATAVSAGNYRPGWKPVRAGSPLNAGVLRSPASGSAWAAGVAGAFERFDQAVLDGVERGEGFGLALFPGLGLVGDVGLGEFAVADVEAAGLVGFDSADARQRLYLALDLICACSKLILTT